MTLPLPHGTDTHRQHRRGSEPCAECDRENNLPEHPARDGKAVVQPGIARPSSHFFVSDVTEVRSQPRSDSRSRGAANMLASAVMAATGAVCFFSARMGGGAVRSAIVAGIHGDEAVQAVSVCAGVLAHLGLGGAFAVEGPQYSWLALSVMPVLPLGITLATSGHRTSLGAKLVLSALARTPQVLFTESFRELLASRGGYRVLLGPDVSQERAEAFAGRGLATALLVFMGIAAMNYVAGGLKLDVEVLQDTRGMDGAASGQGALGWGEGFGLEMRGETAAAFVEAGGLFVQGLLTGALAHAQGATLRLEPYGAAVSARVREALPRRWMGGMGTGEWFASLRPLMGRLRMPSVCFELMQQLLNAVYYASAWRAPDTAAERGSEAPQVGPVRRVSQEREPQRKASSSAEEAFELYEQTSSENVRLHVPGSIRRDAKHMYDSAQRSESVCGESDFDDECLPGRAMSFVNSSVTAASIDRTPESTVSQSTRSISRSIT